MRKSFSALILLALSFSGAAIAAAPAKTSVTLLQSRQVAIVGDAIQLHGYITPAAANQDVTVTASPMGQPARMIALKTDASGKFTLQVQPTIETTYKAAANGAQSSLHVVLVRPRVSLRKVAPNRFGVIVVGANSFAGQMVSLQRFVARPGVVGKGSRANTWVTIKKAALVASARTTSQSEAEIQLKVRRGTKLRVYFPHQPNSGYLDGHSNFIVV